MQFKDCWIWNEDVDIRLDSFLDMHPDLFAFIEAVGKIQGDAMKAYLTFMAQRIIEMHRLLRQTGSLYLHYYQTAIHYLKGILDSIFGKGNFRNEIIWNYGKWSNVSKGLQKNHDNILFYSKSDKYQYNVRYIDKHTVKNYGTNIINGVGQLLIYDTDNTPKEIIDKYTLKGYKIVYVKNNKVADNDTWTYLRDKSLNILNSQSKERTGYPTQKPLALLNPIKASSNEGDLVLDPFCGCATTCVSADNLSRKWVGIDISEMAATLVSERLETMRVTVDEPKTSDLYRAEFEVSFKYPTRTDVSKLAMTKPDVRKHFYGQQDGNCNGCGTHFDRGVDFHIDHIYPESKGSAWTLDNLQLLCGSCNSIKGDRPMEYLQMRIKARNKKWHNKYLKRKILKINKI